MFVIKVRRPDGTIENVKKNGTITQAKFDAMKEATFNAGRGELLEWRNLEVKSSAVILSEKDIKVANLKQQIVAAHNSNNAGLVCKLEKQLAAIN